MKLLKRNNIYIGIILALIAPVVSYAILWAISRGFEVWLNDGQVILKQETMLMSSLFLNLFIFLPYLKFDKYEKTGRGVLLVTFIGVVVLFLTQFN